MDRRTFLQATGALLAGAAASREAPAESATGIPTPTAQAAVRTGGRLVLPVNRNWRFSPTVVQGGHDPHFDDSGFERVVVPHTNVRLPWHGFSERRSQFVSLYRRRFRLPPEARGRRVFVDFEGVMTASTVWLNGVRLGEYKGGYTPFSFDLTTHVAWDDENVLAVDVDSTERADIPPFGYEIDYLTFGGIYREVALRVVPATFIENVFARPVNVLSPHPAVDVECFIQHLEAPRAPLTLEVELRDGDRSLAKRSQRLPRIVAGTETASRVRTTAARGPRWLVRLEGFGPATLWDLANPKLYEVRVTLLEGTQPIDEERRRIGFREARFTDHGFELNGNVVKLRGLNRHQTYPFVGQAMPARAQRRDAEILKRELSCNIVRTSHYPQSRHFLDACDEFGLLVLEEVPGWQHLGDAAWKELVVDNVRRMIQRDWNHPAIILWGVRVNESIDDHELYTRTNALARQVDPTRQTGGIRYNYDSEFLEDVFTMNDFGFPLRPPKYPRYLNTEFVGHTFPTKTIDNVERLTEHTLRHARIHDQIASDPRYAGGIGWCAFDYNTHGDFGSGDHICYHGVSDIFREPKPAAGFYRSQCDPAEKVVLEPAFHWARGDESVGFSRAVICSNCDRIKLFIDGKLVTEAEPDRKAFPHLAHPPFVIPLQELFHKWGDLRLEGYLQDKLVVTRNFSGKGVDEKFVVRADDAQLIGDGADATRVVLRVTDEFGNIRPFANDAISLTIEGPGEIVGDNPFSLVGGTGAIWIRTKEQAGTIRLTARHPTLGAQTATFQISEVPAERV